MAQSPESKLIEWDDERYSTNIERFDEQHQYLFGLLNELYVAMDEGRSDEEVGDILRELERYTEYHFGDEEEFMQDCGYSMECADCFYNHREKHEEFEEKVRDLRQRHENDEHIELEVLTFVSDWLDSHIAGVNQDQNYSEYFEENISDDYEYTPGKLKKSRDVEAAHPEALQDSTSVADLDVSLGSEVRTGGELSIPDGPVAAWFENLCDRHGDRTAVQLPDRPAHDSLTFDEVREEARAVAAGLLEMGLEPGDRVGIYANPTYEWSVVDMACHLAGLVSVPVSNLYSDERALHIIDDAGVDVLVAERMLPVPVEQAVDSVAYIDDLPTGTATDLPGFDRDGDEVATIVYKLGTNKHPRGCALTDENLRAGTQMLTDQLSLDAGGTGTCFLPLAHIYQRLAGYVLWQTGNAIAYMDTDEFEADLRTVEPDVLVGVPQAYEQLRGSIEDRMREMSGARKFIAGNVPEKYGAKMRDDASASRRLSVKHSMAEKTVFGRLREEFGLSNVSHALTGTESIDDETIQFFWGFGVPIREVYESTELTGLATMTGADDYRADIVGTPLPGTEVALAQDDEVVVRGPCVMDGYWNDEEATAYAIRDGWYHTGDIGAFDDDGSLRIVGSK
ncbi:bacteriohemerythrin [Salinibaculum rarum]|uniref:bacteriohemerythrin n=1 Tax=Salinibaculum rarum TaxID=3058903 RepID=UPI0026601C49|nr:bacteriohemerythrin [Salinibaculum sp. KK48]